jgi:light-regulated signal transduction histidine kinase (bacteriophytochrome)
MQSIADLVTALAYFTIPILLLRIARRRRELRFRSVLFCFGAFIVASGITHVTGVLNIWHTAFWVEAILKVITAILAIPTAVLLWRSLPDVLSMPSQRQLRDANESLARANRELEAFTASVSHDLRSPLTTIAGQAGLLEVSMPHAAEEQRRRLTKIQTSVKQMSDLIDALLALSRISRHTLHREMIDVSALAHTIVHDLRQSEPHREVEVTIQPDLHVHGDRRLIGDLLRNLLENAWKFTAKTSAARIELGGAALGAMATLHVRDNGAGFDMAHAKKLFRPFHRLHSAAEFDGSGIGLATVARIVERHGGRVWAEAKPNEGAVFYFTLPTMPITGEILAQQPVRANA